MSESAPVFSFWRLLFLILGLGLLGAVISRLDLEAVAGQVQSVGWGVLAILGIYLLAFLADTWSWRLVIVRERLANLSFGTLFKVRMVGAAWNRVTPVFGMAGEPVKAVLLRRYHGIDYQEGAASLVIAKTANLIALIIFLTGGLTLALVTENLPADYRWGALVALVTLTIGIAALFLVQRFRLGSVASQWFGDRSWGQPINKFLFQLQQFDDRLVAGYTQDRRRFMAAVGLTLGNWILGAVELWLTMWLLGHPISMAEAWCADAAVELVRAATFFIPASIGTQEAALVLVLGHITGQPPLGLAVAVIRRFRELVWVVWGFAINWLSFRRPVAA